MENSVACGLGRYHLLPANNKFIRPVEFLLHLQTFLVSTSTSYPVILTKGKSQDGTHWRHSCRKRVTVLG